MQILLVALQRSEYFNLFALGYTTKIALGPLILKAFDNFIKVGDLLSALKLRFLFVFRVEISDTILRNRRRVRGRFLRSGLTVRDIFRIRRRSGRYSCRIG